MSPWADDALFMGPLIVARLKAEVPALRQVLLIDDLGGIERDNGLAAAQCPAVVVGLASMEPTSDAGRKTVTVVQDWHVYLGVASVAAQADRQRTVAGPLITQIVRALQGWVPAGINFPLGWAPGPRVRYGRDVSWFPLNWRIAPLVSTTT